MQLYLQRTVFKDLPQGRIGRPGEQDFGQADLEHDYEWQDKEHQQPEVGQCDDQTPSLVSGEEIAQPFAGAVHGAING